MISTRYSQPPLSSSTPPPQFGAAVRIATRYTGEQLLQGGFLQRLVKEGAQIFAIQDEHGHLIMEVISAPPKINRHRHRAFFVGGVIDALKDFIGDTIQHGDHSLRKGSALSNRDRPIASGIHAEVYDAIEVAFGQEAANTVLSDGTKHGPISNSGKRVLSEFTTLLEAIEAVFGSEAANAFVKKHASETTFSQIA